MSLIAQIIAFLIEDSGLINNAGFFTAKSIQIQTKGRQKGKGAEFKEVELSPDCEDQKLPEHSHHQTNN